MKSGKTDFFIGTAGVCCSTTTGWEISGKANEGAMDFGDQARKIGGANRIFVHVSRDNAGGEFDLIGFGHCVLVYFACFST